MAGAAALFSSCSSGSSNTNVGTNTTATTTTASTSAGPTTCQASQLRASRVASSAAAGHIAVTYGLTNASAATCTLFGYPGLQMLDASGRPIPTQVSHGGSFTFPVETPMLVTMSAGAQASFFLGYADVPSGNETSCPQSARLDITPPGSTGTVQLADQIAPCGRGSVTVSPVHAGTAPPH
jgi:hypothetical protein